MEILLPIKQKYFDMLVDGTKNIEIRKYLPNLKKGDRVYFYDPDDLKKGSMGNAVVKGYWCPDNFVDFLQQDRFKLGVDGEGIMEYANSSPGQLKFLTFSKVKPSISNEGYDAETLAKRQYEALIRTNLYLHLQKYVIVSK